jgi:hypothetical protein
MSEENPLCGFWGQIHSLLSVYFFGFGEEEKCFLVLLYCRGAVLNFRP